MIQLRHAAVGVGDLDRALRFYREILGFESYHTSDRDWAMVARGGTSVSLVVAHGTHPDHLGVTLPDPAEVDRMRARLAAPESGARQVSEPKWHRDGSYGFYFKDPDGHQLECIFIPHLPRQEHPDRAILLVAHGSADPAWAEPFRAVLERVRRNAAGLEVRLAFLETMRPGVSEALSDLIQEKRPRSVDVVPLFLGTGAHARRDLPALIDPVRAAHPGVRIELRAPIGEDEAVQDALAQAVLTPWLGGG